MQTWALLVDSYRLLVSRKLFWVTLLISALVVLLYASIGFDESGWYILFGLAHFESEMLQAGSKWAESLYTFIFTDLILRFWLAWGAAILALISAAPILNDFMSPGVVDLALSKPVSRGKVFFIKYLGGLLFVLLQMSFFCLGVFLCLGWRVGTWYWSVFAAVPIVTLFFSYLYAVQVLLTMITRSTIASLLLTMLFWLVLFALQFAEEAVQEHRITAEVLAERVERLAEAGSGPEPMMEPLSGVSRDRQEHLKDASQMRTWEDRLGTVLTGLPKTRDTIRLLERWVTVGREYSMSRFAVNQVSSRSDADREQWDALREIDERQTEALHSRPAWRIIGTSLAFEAVVLLLACWIFVRRDF